MCRHPNWGHPDHDACGTGFVARLGAAPAHDIVEFALTALERLTHRGGVDADGASGDGAGLLTSLPKEFFRARALEEGVQLPEAFGLGFAFLAAPFSLQARSAIHAAAEAQELEIVAWRRVPIDPSTLGARARESMPEIWQFYVEAEKPDADFERQLALLRKRAEPLLPPRCYICSLSSRSVVYKGLLTPWQFPQFYEDLRDPSFTATFAVFHQRYSTNTQPSWDLAQPFRHVAHNGEINTILSNRRWTRARENELRARLGVDDWFAALEQGVSDSASFDNAFELKLLEGYTPAAAMLALVPPAFEKDPHLSRDVRAALRARSRDGEPWDGPAALVFYGGGYVGAKLDRNGLRPLRYTVTHDGLIMAGSGDWLDRRGRIEHRRAAEAWSGRNDSRQSGKRNLSALARHTEAAGGEACRAYCDCSITQRNSCRGSRAQRNGSRRGTVLACEARRHCRRLDRRSIQNFIFFAYTR